MLKNNTNITSKINTDIIMKQILYKINTFNILINTFNTFILINTFMMSNVTKKILFLH